MKSHEQIAMSIGTLDESVLTASPVEKERLRARAEYHALLARRPALGAFVSPLLRLKNSAEIIRSIR